MRRRLLRSGIERVVERDRVGGNVGEGLHPVANKIGGMGLAQVFVDGPGELLRALAVGSLRTKALQQVPCLLIAHSHLQLQECLECLEGNRHRSLRGGVKDDRFIFILFIKSSTIGFVVVIFGVFKLIIPQVQGGGVHDWLGKAMLLHHRRSHRREHLHAGRLAKLSSILYRPLANFHRRTRKNQRFIVFNSWFWFVCRSGSNASRLQHSIFRKCATLVADVSVRVRGQYSLGVLQNHFPFAPTIGLHTHNEHFELSGTPSSNLGHSQSPKKYRADTQKTPSNKQN